MPAEWEPHEATWLAWPHEKSDWPRKFAPIPWLYGEIVRASGASGTRSHYCHGCGLEEPRATNLNEIPCGLAAVRIFSPRTNRSWTRDYGPLFVKVPQAKLL